MNAGGLLQIIMIIIGLSLFGITIISLARKNMNESFWLFLHALQADNFHQYP